MDKYYKTHPTMEYNAAVEEYQETEYPMLQGKTPLFLSLSQLIVGHRKYIS